MKTSILGLNLIKSFEGVRLLAYKCPAGILTIGYGHTGSDVTKGKTITLNEAENLLKKDLKKYESAVNNSVKVPLNQNQFDALVSWTYNVGVGAMANSTLLKKLNAGLYHEVPTQLKRWNKASGKVLSGLVRRREAESALFITPIEVIKEIVVSETFKKVQKALAYVLNIEENLDEKIKPESTLEELGADSLDYFEALMELEEQIGHDIPDEYITDVKTVQDIADAVDKFKKDKEL